LLSGVSLEFRSLRTRRFGETVQRLRAHIDKVSLCRFPAYVDARVLAVREFADFYVDEYGEPPSAPDVIAEAAAAVSPETTFVDRLRAERAAPLDYDRLAAVGVDALQRNGMTTGTWDGSPGRFSDEEYERSTLLCRPGAGPVKDRCSLPVLEPDGVL